MANILICDDSSFTRKMIKNIIKAEGHSFVETDEGDSLLQIIKDQKFDCILLDLLMPNKTGFDVLKELKNLNYKCPVIIISADTQDTSKKMCMLLGAAAYINKPPKHDELVQAINNVII